MIRSCIFENIVNSKLGSFHIFFERHFYCLLCSHSETIDYSIRICTPPSQNDVIFILLHFEIDEFFLVWMVFIWVKVYILVYGLFCKMYGFCSFSGPKKNDYSVEEGWEPLILTTILLGLHLIFKTWWYLVDKYAYLVVHVIFQFSLWT